MGKVKTAKLKKNKTMGKSAVQLINEYIDENNYPAKLHGQVHDQVITEVREDKVEEWNEIVKDLMMKSSNMNLSQSVESKISDKWEK